MLPKKRQPTHPGEILLEEFLIPLEISQTKFAEHLGESWTQPKVSAIVKKKRRVTESVALNFSDAFGTTPEFWLNLQICYHLWQAIQEHERVPEIPQLKRH